VSTGPSRKHRYLTVNIKNLLSHLKNNFGEVIILMFIGWYFYQIHIDGLKHSSDKYISLSEAWGNLKSNMHEMINACDVAQGKLTIPSKRSAA
jgi:hypothetical protein